MKEKENNQTERIQLPPPWCSSICRNAMNEECIEHCAIVRDCSAFEIRPNLKLGDMPRFPLKESAEMTKEEKFTSVIVYLAKVVDHLQGVEDEPIITPIRRPNHDRTPGSQIPANLKVEDLLSGFHEANSPHSLGTECESPEIGPSEVAGTSA